MSTPVVLQDRYHIVQRLGSGGQGNVYLADDERLPGKRWAIKELHESDQALHAQLQRQFDEEARVLAHLEHPGLPRVADYFSEGDRHYLVMEFIVGDDLDGLVRQRGGPLPEGQAIEISRQLCDILEYLHNQSPQPIIHRDLKPSNIKIAANGRVRLVDFGLAKMAAPGEPSKTIVRGSGTPGFSPLEQYGQGGTDQRSDIYSLGCCLYYMLTDTVPPEAPDRSVNPRLLRSIRDLNPRVSAELAQVVDRAMQLHATARYASAAEMARALVRSGELVDSASAPSGRSMAGALPFVAAGCTLGLGLGWFPTLLLPAGGDNLLVLTLIGSLFFCAVGATAGLLVGYRVSAARLMFMRQVVHLLIAAIAGELLLISFGWALLTTENLALPLATWTVAAGWIGGVLGVVGLIKIPYVRRAWPR